MRGLISRRNVRTSENSRRCYWTRSTHDGDAEGKDPTFPQDRYPPAEENLDTRRDCDSLIIENRTLEGEGQNALKPQIGGSVVNDQVGAARESRSPHPAARPCHAAMVLNTDDRISAENTIHTESTAMSMAVHYISTRRHTEDLYPPIVLGEVQVIKI